VKQNERKEKIMFKLSTLIVLLISIHICQAEDIPIDDYLLKYKFEGNSNDISGNYNNGIVAGAYLTSGFDLMQFSAYYFDGNNDYIITEANDFLDTQQSGAVSLWINPDEIPESDEMTLFCYSTMEDGGSNFRLSIKNQKLYIAYKYEFALSPTHIGSTILDANTWYHIVVNADGINPIEVYINDQREDMEFDDNSTSADGSEWFADIPRLSENNHFFAIGKFDRQNQSDNFFFNGTVDNVSIFSRNLTAGEISNLYSETSENIMIANYPFNGNTNDLSGFDNHCTSFGAQLVSGLDGTLNSAYYFDGNNDYIITEANDFLDTQQSGAVSLWINPDEIPESDEMTLFCYSTMEDGGSNFRLSIKNQKLYIAYKYEFALSPTHIGSTILDANTWYHIVVNADGINPIEVYINDQREDMEFDDNSTSADGSEWFADIPRLSENNHFFAIGKFDRQNQSNNFFFNGVVDDISIFSRNLTAGEISNLYSETSENIMIANYPFNGNTNDLSGFDNHCTSFGAQLVSGLDGTLNSAYYFDGNNDYIITEANDFLDTQQSGAVSLWINPDEIPESDEMTLFCYSTMEDGGSNFRLSIKNQKLYIAYKYEFALSPTHIGSTILDANTWYHIVVNADGINPIEVYINDQREDMEFDDNSTSADGSEWFADIPRLSENNHFFAIGKFDRQNQSNNFFFNGVVDDIRIYSEAINRIVIHDIWTSLKQEALQLLSSVRLNLNYPNPFNPSTTIPYAIAKPGQIDISIYNITGQKVATLESGFKTAGDHEAAWDATGFASGVYLVRLSQGKQHAYRKILLVK
jgi:uncharacterized membrane protein